MDGARLRAGRPALGVAAHHADPDLEWYRIPARHRELGSDALAAAGAGLYEGGYLQVFRAHLFRPFGTPPDPLAAQRG